MQAFGVVHRDLKLENIMMTDDSETAVPKIIDFGLARVLHPGETSAEPFGTLGYVSPEVLRKQPYSFSCDIWSLGCLAYALHSGSLPFDHQDAHKTIKMTLEKPLAFDLPCWQAVSQEAQDFIARCLQKDVK
jgi:serine/threonine protein kinase